MKRFGNPVDASGDRAVRSGRHPFFCLTLVLALITAVSACNLHPISRSLTRFGYMDTSGRVVIKAQFTDAQSFSDGLAAVEVDGKWGYIDREGQMVIQPQFLKARSFSNGRARVEVSTDRWRYIDRSGKAAGDIQFKWSIHARDFSEGLAAVYVEDRERFECLPRVVVNGRRTFIDKTGKRLTETTFDDVKDFHEGLAQVRIGDRWGYVDRTGKMAIPAEFTMTGRFSEGLAAARRSGKLGGYIDRTGAMVIREQFGVAWPFPDGLARVKNGEGSGLFDNWGYIDRSGKVVLSRSLKQGCPFREGLALIGNGGPI